MSPEQKAEAIRQMQLTEGWAIVAAYVVKKIEYHRNQLMTCEEMNTLIKHRAAIRTLEAFNGNIDEILRSEGDENP